jgi:hypothetical protein
MPKNTRSPTRILAGDRTGNVKLLACSQFFRETPGHYWNVTRIVDPLLAGRNAVAGEVLPIKAKVEEDSNASAAHGTHWFGLSGGPGLIFNRSLGYIHRMVKFVRAKDAQEGKRGLHLPARCRCEPIQARAKAGGRDRRRGLPALSDD